MTTWSGTSATRGPMRATTFHGTPFSGKGCNRTGHQPRQNRSLRHPLLPLQGRHRPGSRLARHPQASGPTVQGRMGRHRLLEAPKAPRTRGYRVCFRCRKIAYRGGIGADKDWCDACGYGSGAGDAWVAKARRSTPQKTSSGSTQVHFVCAVLL